MKKIIFISCLFFLLFSCKEDSQDLHHQVDFFCHNQTSGIRMWLESYEKMPDSLRMQRYMLDEAVRVSVIYDKVLFCAACRERDQNEMNQLGEVYSRLDHDIRVIRNFYYDSLPQVKFDSLKVLMRKAENIWKQLNSLPLRD